MHLSQYSYIDRGLGNLFVLVFCLLRIYQVDRFRSLLTLNLRELQLKTLATLLLLLSLIVMLAYDTLGIYVKYHEGYDVKPTEGGSYTVKVKPLSLYTVGDKHRVEAANILLDLAWCSKSSAYFVMFSIFSEISQGLLHQTIIPIREVRIILAHSALNIALFITMPLAFKSDILLSVIAPQFVYHGECAILIILGYINIRRFNQHSRDLMDPGSKQLLWFYIDMTYLFITALFLDMIGLLIINADLLHQSTLAKSSFATDVLTKTFNWGSVLSYPVAIMIMYPKSTTYAVPPKHKVSLQDIVRRGSLEGKVGRRRSSLGMVDRPMTSVMEAPEDGIAAVNIPMLKSLSEEAPEGFHLR